MAGTGSIRTHSAATAAAWQRQRDHKQILADVDRNELEEFRIQATRPGGLPADFAASITPLDDSNDIEADTLIDDGEADDADEQDMQDEEESEMATIRAIEEYGQMATKSMLRTARLPQPPSTSTHQASHQDVGRSKDSPSTHFLGSLLAI